MKLILSILKVLICHFLFIDLLILLGGYLFFFYKSFTRVSDFLEILPILLLFNVYFKFPLIPPATPARALSVRTFHLRIPVCLQPPFLAALALGVSQPF